MYQQQKTQLEIPAMFARALGLMGKKQCHVIPLGQTDYNICQYE